MSLAGKRILIAKPGLDGHDVGAKIIALALRDAGAIVEFTDFTVTTDHERTWMRLWRVFMATYYGHLVAEFGDRMDPQVLGYIERGNAMSAVDHKRLEYGRTDLWRRAAAMFADHDALLCPTMATGPLPAAKADSGDDAVDMTGVFNLVAPCPALSVPCGAHTEAPYTGVPIGLQIVGHRWRDDTVLRIGRAVEQALWPTGLPRPPL
jgi:Asp-tRNA(Asn)/Glu-tRNA(Gln) amidotransferase A subunit family amidase